jgi:hypothetical protein
MTKLIVERLTIAQQLPGKFLSQRVGMTEFLSPRSQRGDVRLFLV